MNSELGLNWVYTAVLGNKQLFLDVAFQSAYSVEECTSAVKW